MTTCSNCYTPHKLNSSPLLIFAIIAGLVLLGVAVIPNLHAEVRHPDEYAAIRKCISNSGPFMTYREPDKITFHLLCRLDGGKVGDQVVVKKDGKIIEESAYIPKEGNWQAILKWLLNKGATKWTGGL